MLQAPRVLLAAATLLLLAAPPAAAQDDAPIGRFVADLRGSFVPFGQNADLAATRGFHPAVTPSLGVGFDAGVHVHLFRLGFVTFGLGAIYHASNGDWGGDADAVRPPAPALRKTFRTLSPQLSFNFGGRDGWSYVSGGVGRSRLTLFRRDSKEPSVRPADTLNYGGGARWFVNRRVALSLDLRFYAVSPLERTATEPASPRMTLVVASVGAAFK